MLVQVHHVLLGDTWPLINLTNLAPTSNVGNGVDQLEKWRKANENKSPKNGGKNEKWKKRTKEEEEKNPSLKANGEAAAENLLRDSWAIGRGHWKLDLLF